MSNPVKTYGKKGKRHVVFFVDSIDTDDEQKYVLENVAIFWVAFMSDPVAPNKKADVIATVNKYVFFLIYKLKIAFYINILWKNNLSSTIASIVCGQVSPNRRWIVL